MKYRAMMALLGFVALRGSLLAQGAQPAELSFDGLALSSFDATNHQPLLLHSSPFLAASNRFAPITLAQTSLLSYPAAFGLFGATPLDYFPSSLPAYPAAAMSGTERPGGYRDLPSFLSSFSHASGEVGFFYGKGTGKSDLEATSGYVIGEIDNGNTQITVGASYSKVNARQPR